MQKLWGVTKHFKDEVTHIQLKITSLLHMLIGPGPPGKDTHNLLMGSGLDIAILCFNILLCLG